MDPDSYWINYKGTRFRLKGFVKLNDVNLFKNKSKKYDFMGFYSNPLQLMIKKIYLI